MRNVYIMIFQSKKNPARIIEFATANADEMYWMMLNAVQHGTGIKLGIALEIGGRNA